MKYKIKVGWMEEVIPTGLSPSWMVEGEVGSAAESKEVEMDVEANDIQEALSKVAEKVGIPVDKFAYISVNGKVLRP